ncbi:hypothetical protein D3C87_1665430 [compost metagenome]
MGGNSPERRRSGLAAATGPDKVRMSLERLTLIRGPAPKSPGTLPYCGCVPVGDKEIPVFDSNQGRYQSRRGRQA